ncbi:unnamed protein product [Didymodactylos carnosus]|uniref:Uncharacterized protein n=1 Tax=Didymodactylos carnosus TaxID=1234261 RepID=A0A814HT94_9BILA|nr:unnamed protein product [Didymodactylos carnosus]CAF1168358.1 unnamed protein product [Didymodactylos carnosus]CAF3784299.1 unnamed protein product [Didymodactylos carnosus]CAF3979828.1 unnamed protein product [Didymodactylos carnosus]
MNPMTTYSNLNDGITTRRYTGFPLNSTLVSAYTPDTIRNIITHAAAGQPYTTAVWIRVSRMGIRINAQNPQVASTRVPVFIPISLVHDIFIQPNIPNVICIVYDEIQSKMKGVLLYVVQSADAVLLREDIRAIKQQVSVHTPAPYVNPFDSRFANTNVIGRSQIPPPYSTYLPPHSQDQPLRLEPNMLQRISPPVAEVYRGNVTEPPTPMRRVVYLKNGSARVSPTGPYSDLPQLGCAPSKGSYNGHERRRSPRKKHHTKPSTDSGSRHRRKVPLERSRSLEKNQQIKADSNHLLKNGHQSTDTDSKNLSPQQLQQILYQQQQQQIAAMMAMQKANQVPIVPLGIYNRYVPKTIPLPSGDTIKTTVPQPPIINGNDHNQTLNSRGEAFLHHEQNGLINNHSKSRSVSRSSSRNRQKARPASVQHPFEILETRHHHHHHRHSHKIPPNGANWGAMTVKGLSTRNRRKYSDSKETKQYLKQLLDEVQNVKTEMNRIKQTAVMKNRPDSLKIDLREIKPDIEQIRIRANN